MNRKFHQTAAIFFLPLNKMIPAVIVVNTSSKATGNMLLVFNSPIKLEMMLEMPSCKKPMSADALPIL